jgi:hypothetical protein
LQMLCTIWPKSSPENRTTKDPHSCKGFFEMSLYRELDLRWDSISVHFLCLFVSCLPVKPCLNLLNSGTNNFVFFYICRLKKHLPHTKNANLHILLGNNLAALSEYQEALDQYSIGIRYV